MHSGAGWCAPLSFRAAQKSRQPALVLRQPSTWSCRPARIEAALPKEWVQAFKRNPARVSWALRHWVYQQLQRHSRRIPRAKQLQRTLVGHWRVFEHSSPRAALEFVAGLLVVARRYQKVLLARRASH
jgi:hypothetical protein